jgi:serine/threonine-protein kinase
VFTEQDTETASDIWILPLEGERTPRPIVVTPAIELFPAVSPDGRWLAYTSTESRREEVYVQPFPGGGHKWAVSKDGGSQPVWSANGRELFYRSGTKMMVVPLAAGSEFRPGDARVLFTIPFDAGGVYATYSVSRDGQRFLMPETPGTAAPPPQIVVVLDWFSELLSKLR